MSVTLGKLLFQLKMFLQVRLGLLFMFDGIFLSASFKFVVLEIITLLLQ
jgi:hypothetical protein